MKFFDYRILIVVLLAFIFSCKSTKNLSKVNDAKVRIAFLGNSITYGFGICNRKHNSFPGIIQDSFKNNCVVGNFGVCSSTLLKKGYRSYRFTKKYKKAIAFNPDIIFIKLGSNDPTPMNWKYKSEFVDDYNSFIDTLSKLPKHPLIILLTPVTYYRNYANKTAIIRDTVCPLVMQIAKNNNLNFIDLQTPTVNRKNLFWDGAHPNKKGAELIAGVILSYIRKNNIIK